jgi:hypothetical protein
MSYRVIWNRTELRALADIYVKVPDKRAVAASANFLERMLMIDPHNAGKPLGKRHRKVFVTPLTVEYKIDDANRIVTILRVRFGDHTT